MASGSSPDIIELEHVIGYTGHHLNTLHYHPADPNIIVYGIGAVVVIEDITDPHRQTFLRGHDGEVSALAVSADGQLIASGQLGSVATKEQQARVCVWQYGTRLQAYVLHGLTHAVRNLFFSPDGAFLAASDQNNILIVWDMRSGDVVYSKRSESPCSLVTWGAVSRGANPSYILFTAYASEVFINRLEVDPRSMRYVAKVGKCQLPSSGLVRQYVFGITLVDAAGEFLLAGTSSGEFMVFNAATGVFRASIPVSSNGTLSLTRAGRYLFAGAGDGKVKKMTGSDTRWMLEAETTLEGKIVSLSPNPEGTELLCGTSSGKIYRLLTSDLSSTQVAESHVDAVRDISFGSRSDVFCTVSDGGAIKVWDLSDYTVLARAGARERATCAVFAADNTIISGWESGCIRCFDASNGSAKWEIPNAHRGAVKSIAETDVAIISGGQDGCVRVWARKSRELKTQFSEHRKEVTKVLFDVEIPYLLHSCSSDKSVMTYNLKTNSRTTIHVIRNGSFSNMAQRRDQDHELITAGSDGNLQFWNRDSVDPVAELRDPGRAKINSVRVSPSGRFLVTGADDNAIKIYEISSGTLLASGTGHSGSLSNLEWSPDEKQIVSVAADCCICVWNFYGA